MVGIGQLTLGTLDTSRGSGALKVRLLRDMGLSPHRHYPAADSWPFFVMQPGHRETVRGVSNLSVNDICNGDPQRDGRVDVIVDMGGMCLPLEVGM